MNNRFCHFLKNIDDRMPTDGGGTTRRTPTDGGGTTRRAPTDGGGTTRNGGGGTR